MLVDQNIEHDAVDTVVLPIQKSNLNCGLLLTVAVDTAFSLFVPSRIPREVVVDHRVKRLLQVDALAQAVGGNEQPLVVEAQLFNPVFPFGRREQARDTVDFKTFYLELFAKLSGDVFGSGDVPTKHDRRAFAFEHVAQQLD